MLKCKRITADQSLILNLGFWAKRQSWTLICQEVWTNLWCILTNQLQIAPIKIHHQAPLSVKGLSKISHLWMTWITSESMCKENNRIIQQIFWKSLIRMHLQIAIKRSPWIALKKTNLILVNNSRSLSFLLQIRNYHRLLTR